MIAAAVAVPVGFVAVLVQEGLLVEGDAEPFSVRLNAFCALRSFLPARRSKRGLSTFRPSEPTAKYANPRSIPTSFSEPGKDSSFVSTTKEAKYRSAASLTTVTEDGSDGRFRDQRTDTSPIFGRRSFPPAVTANRALRVNRIACRLFFFERNRGGATLAPLRLPVIESKEFRYAAFRSASACCSTTEETWLSQERSGAFFALVMTRLERSASEM
ncbi:hypothetical protein HDA43_000067 [Streptosporangium sandarakinum]|uniref:Uncharacterized protein n=1 Tax=Streptosporangium sandarakinum TaxID=1260955 RepID=A0A852UQJ9_9ACTN|nr:hypothetical protein [Streptosporangium sandarakinum]